jgi:hypothetical protein
LEVWTGREAAGRMDRKRSSSEKTVLNKHLSKSSSFPVLIPDCFPVWVKKGKGEGSGVVCEIAATWRAEVVRKFCWPMRMVRTYARRFARCNM